VGDGDDREVDLEVVEPVAGRPAHELDALAERVGGCAVGACAREEIRCRI